MDLSPRALLAPAIACLLAGCAAETPLEYGRDALLLPATLQETLPLARARAQEVASGAYVTRLGGGFSVMDATGRGPSHTFVFHARVAPQTFRRITVHVIHGSPWVDDVPVSPADAPAPFDEAELTLDSDGVVERTVQLAPSYGVAPGDAYAARLSAVPSFPEPPGGVGDVVAWRVDVLVLLPSGDGPPVYFSAARFYFDPETAELLDDPVIPGTGPELYPWP